MHAHGGDSYTDKVMRKSLNNFLKLTCTLHILNSLLSLSMFYNKEQFCNPQSLNIHRYKWP